MISQNLKRLEKLEKQIGAADDKTRIIYIIINPDGTEAERIERKLYSTS